MDAHRCERVAEALREELGELINYELADPRIGLISVTEVLVSPDLRLACVRVSPAGDAAQRQQTMTALSGARHYLRRVLAARLEMYRVPELRFEPDLEQDLNSRARGLMKRVKKGRPRDLDEAADPQKRSPK